ncbi:MAG: hypothetical protein IPM26_11420 [Saprospiraceae bacterium]|nr:hypothetical protein [Saprospiraceae bacterium]
MKLKYIITAVSIAALLTYHADAQINVNKYLWEYPLQRDLIMDEDLTFTIRTEMQKIIDSGSLMFRPVNCRYSDVMYDHYALYHEPGRLLQTVAMAYPYLTAEQQDSLRIFVSRLIQNTVHRPWATGQVPGDNGLNRDFFLLPRYGDSELLSDNTGLLYRMCTAYGCIFTGQVIQLRYSLTVMISKIFTTIKQLPV